MGRKSKKTQEELNKFNILITGSDNYNNVSKFNKVMGDIIKQLPPLQQLMIYTFDSRYGAQLLARLYAEQLGVYYQGWNIATYFVGNHFKRSNPIRLQQVMLKNAIKKSDLILIFSNELTPNIDNVIKLAIKQDKFYNIIKQ